MLFQARVGKPFIRLIKDSIPARIDPSQKMFYQPSVFLIHEKYPASLPTRELPIFGEYSNQTLIGQFGRDLPAKSLDGTELEKAASDLSDLSTE